MKTQLFRYIFKRNFSVTSNLRPFMRKQSKPKIFWYFRDSVHFKELTFRNEKCYQNSSEETKLRKQLSDSIIKHSIDVVSDTTIHELPLNFKLFVLDALLVIRGSDDKITTNFFDVLRPQIIFELQKQNIFVLIYLLYLSSIIKTENRDDFSFLVSKIIQRIEDLFLNKSLNEKQLCATDIAVLCDSLFCLKITFKSKVLVLDLISNLVIEEIKTNRLNRSHVLSIIKYMRFIESNDPKVIDAIKSYIEINFNSFSFTECAHYLAFFANLSIYEQNIYNSLVDKRSDQLLNKCLQQNNKTIRSKDLSRFLWSTASINHRLNQSTTDCVVAIIENLLKTQFLSYPHFLIDCLKSLIILGIYPQKLFETLNSKQFVKLISKSDRNKVSKDLYFILESIAIERPDFKLEDRAFIYSLATEFTHNINNESKSRKKLSIYLDFINNYQKCCETELSPKLFYSLRHIGIASISVKGTSLEVIDSTVIVLNDSHLNGLMSTKVRQMTSKNIPHLLIHNLEDLKHFLLFF